MNKHKYYIYSKQDVLRNLEDVRDVAILIDGITLKNKTPVEDNDYFVQIKFHNDRYKWITFYKVNNNDPIQMSYFILSIEDTVDLLYDLRKYSNNSIKKWEKIINNINKT